MSGVWGFVPVGGRGSLPFTLVHGESLVATASWAVQAAEVPLLDTGTPWPTVVASGRGLLLHDPLCPLTPVTFLADCARHAVERSAVVVGYRPVTDTVKEYSAGASSTSIGMVGSTVDRSGLVEITSPVVLPAAVTAALQGPPTGTFPELVEVLRARWPVRLVESPALARRVHREEDLAVLEALSLPG